MNNSQKIKAFLSPLGPLGDALTVFFKTTIGIILLLILSLILVVSIIISFIHHRLIERKNYYPFESEKNYYIHSHYPRHDGFDFIQKEFDTIEKELSMHQQNIFQTLHDNSIDDNTVLPYWKGTGNQSISKYSDINGKTIGYNLTISNNMIQGTITGSMSQQIINNFKEAHILLTGSSFELPYTLQNLGTIVTILEGK